MQWIAWGGTLKLIVVLGHSGCGALTTAVDVFLNPGEYLAIAAKHSIWDILDRSIHVVQASANKLLTVFGSDVARSPGYRNVFRRAALLRLSRAVVINRKRGLPQRGTPFHAGDPHRNRCDDCPLHHSVDQ